MHPALPCCSCHAADKVFMPPTGMLALLGFASSQVRPSSQLLDQQRQPASNRISSRNQQVRDRTVILNAMSCPHRNRRANTMCCGRDNPCDFLCDAGVCQGSARQAEGAARGLQEGGIQGTPHCSPHHSEVDGVPSSTPCLYLACPSCVSSVL
jgi:hypothetical protein